MHVAVMQSLYLDALGIGQIEREQRRPEEQEANGTNRDVGIVRRVVLVGELARLGFITLDFHLDLLAGQIVVVCRHHRHWRGIATCASAERERAQNSGKDYSRSPPKAEVRPEPLSSRHN